MSTDEVASRLNENSPPPSGLWGFLLGLAIKYGLPSLTCVWLFYVIWCKDQIIYEQSTQVTAALVESNHARDAQTAAIEKQATATQNLAQAVRDFTK